MDLKVIIQTCTLTQYGNYFIVCQLDEIQYADKSKKSQKFRSEVNFNTNMPSFKKNVYQFVNLSYGSRITLKVAVFNTRLFIEPQDGKQLLEHSLLCGSMQLTLTVKILETLRLEGELQYEDRLLSDNAERGRVSLILRHKSHDLPAIVEDDVEKIEKIYYDPFEEDTDVIKMKLRKISNKLQEHNSDPLMKKLNFLRTAHKNVSYDLAQLRKQKEGLESENLKLAKIVDQKNDVKELHIHLDLLLNSDKGQDIVKKRFALLLNKLEFERKIYHELSNHYYKIEPEHQAAKSSTSSLQQMKDTLNEQEFHILRMQDQLLLLQNLKETMDNQECIISHLQNTVRETTQNYTKLEKQSLMYDLDKARNERELLKLKQRQLEDIQVINKGYIPRDFFEKFKNDEFFRDNPIIINKYKQRSDMLLKEVEILAQQQAEIQASYDNRQIQSRPQTSGDTQILELELQQAENKAEILQEQMLEIAKNYAKQIAELKAQLHQIEAQL